MRRFRYRVRASWVDTDSAGVVHFTNYFRFFEKAEEELYNSLGLDYRILKDRYGVWVPRVEAHCRYLSPTRFNDVLEVSIWAAEIGEKHIKYMFKIDNLTTSKTAAEGWVTIVSASTRENKSVPLPPELKEKLQRFFQS